MMALPQTLLSRLDLRDSCPPPASVQVVNLNPRGDVRLLRQPGEAAWHRHNQGAGEGAPAVSRVPRKVAAAERVAEIRPAPMCVCTCRETPQQEQRN